MAWPAGWQRWSSRPSCCPASACAVEVERAKPGICCGRRPARDPGRRRRSASRRPVPTSPAAAAATISTRSYDYQLQAKREILAETLRRVRQDRAARKSHHFRRAVELSQSRAVPRGAAAASAIWRRARTRSARWNLPHQLARHQSHPWRAARDGARLAAGRISSARSSFSPTKRTCSSMFWRPIGRWRGDSSTGAARRSRAWFPGALDYPLDGVVYRVSSGSFFQVNRFLVGRLVETALGGRGGRERARPLCRSRPVLAPAGAAIPAR